MPTRAELAAALFAIEENPPADGKDGAEGPQGKAGLDGLNGHDGADGKAGLDGLNGTNGVDGAPGPQGPQGDKGLNWRGAWTKGASYQVDDAVEQSGSSYVAVVATRTKPPSAAWDLLAQKGQDGKAGGTRGYNVRGLASGMVVDDEGTRLNSGAVVGEIDFAGAGVTAAMSGGKAVVTIPGGGGSISVTDGTTTVNPATSIDFHGATVADGGGGEADVTVSAGIDYVQSTDPGAVGAGKTWVQSPSEIGVSAWAPSTFYDSRNSDCWVGPSVSNGFIYKFIFASGTGTSGVTEPIWPLVVGNTVNDNGITWTTVASPSIADLVFAGGSGNWPLWVRNAANTAWQQVTASDSVVGGNVFWTAYFGSGMPAAQLRIASAAGPGALRFESYTPQGLNNTSMFMDDSGIRFRNRNINTGALAGSLGWNGDTIPTTTNMNDAISAALVGVPSFLSIAKWGVR